MPDSYGGIIPAKPKSPETAPQREPLTDADLLRILNAEEADSSSYYASELAMLQAQSMDAFHAKLTDDDIRPNESRVVTHDVEDTVNGLMPFFMRTFAAGPELITVDDDMLESTDPTLKIASDYLGHVLFKDNNGNEIIHDFIFDGLVQIIGVARAWWEDPEPKPAQMLEGVTIEQLIRYTQDPDYEILAQEIETGEDTDEAGEGIEPPDGDDQAMQITEQTTFRLEVQHKPKVGRVKIAVVPPEEFRVSRRARSLAEADYHAWRHEVFIGDVIADFPDRAYELDPDLATSGVKSDQSQTDADLRVLARFPNELNPGQHASRSDDARRKVWQLIEYMRIDFDGDGVTELRRIRRIGDVILENDAVEESEFVTWSPIRVAHRLVGRSLADPLLDIQKIRTVLTRRSLDSMSRSLAPRTFYDRSAAEDDPDFEARLLDHGIGDCIGVEGNPNDKLMTQVTPDVSATAFQAIEYWDRRSEEATGFSKAAQGIRPAEQHDTKGGIELLQSAANARVEQIARWAGLGLEKLLGKVLRLLIAHQDHARIVKINGRQMQIDPRRWRDEMSVTVHVGMAAEGRETKITMLNVILQDQLTALKELGLNNPLVSLQNVRNTLALKVEAMGYKDASRFFSDIPEGWQPPDQGQQQDPKVLEVQGKQAIAEQELNARIERDKAELGQKQQIAQFDHTQRMAEIAKKGDIELEVQKIKADSEWDLQARRMESEERLAIERMNREDALAREKMEREAQLAREQAEIKADLPDAHVGGYRPGGKLDA